MDKVSEKGEQYEEESKEGYVSRTWRWNSDLILTYNNGEGEWAKLSSGRTVTLIRESNGNCKFTWQGKITSLGYQTNNNPDLENLNPKMTVSFLDSGGGVLFFKDIETERYGPEYRYHGLTVRCEYDRTTKECEYNVGVQPYSDVDYPYVEIEGGATIYRCP